MSRIRATLSNMNHGNMSFAHGHTQSVIQHRLAFANRNYFHNISRGIAPKFTYGDRILVIRGKNRQLYEGKGIFEHSNISCDAVITDAFDFPILVPHADCYPVVLHCSEYGIMAAAHGCRESLFQFIISKTVEKMAELNCSPANMTSYIFAGICEKCYQLEYLSRDVPQVLRECVKETEDKKYEIDLRRMIVRQLRMAGIKKIFFPQGAYDRDCTCHSRNGNGLPLYFSNFRNTHGRAEDKFLGNNALFVEMI